MGKGGQVGKKGKGQRDMLKCYIVLITATDFSGSNN